jgi:hypothetical protein
MLAALVAEGPPLEVATREARLEQRSVFMATVLCLLYRACGAAVLVLLLLCAAAHRDAHHLFEEIPQRR